MPHTTPNKRLFDSAFTSSAPGMLVNAHRGFDAHLQAPANATPFTPSALPIPGSWPREDLAADLDVADRIHAAAPSALYTIGRWVISATLGNALALPARLFRRFARKQQIVVQPVFREDGAYKKRIIDAGPADEPTTPTRAPARTTYMKKVGRGRGRAHVVTAPSAFSSGSPVKAQPLSQPDTPETPQSAPDTSDIWTTGPTPIQASVQAPVQAPVQRLAPFRTFAPSQPEAPRPAPETPDIWMTAPTPVKVPVQRLCDLAPKNPPGWPVPTPSPPKSAVEVPHHSPAVQMPSRGPLQISPNSHMNIISNATVTPMRKLLLKNQALEQGAFHVNFPSASDHTVPSPSHRVPEQTELQQKEYQAFTLKNHAAEVARQAQQASEHYRAAAEARHNYVPGMSAAEQEYYNYTETVDQALSFLDDAPDEEDEPPAPSPRPDRGGKKVVRWSLHAHAKPFYCDEKVADMMDSVLEAIHSSPFRSPVKIYNSDTDTSDDEGADAAISPSRSNDGSSTQQEATAKDSVGFTGVPSSTWDDTDDDSLEESQISLEFLGDLQKELQEKLALAPPSPPKVKAFMEPLSEEESKKLEAAAKKTENGRIADAHIVPEKLTAHDFSTLLPRMFSGDPKAWLNDNIVNEYLGVLIEHLKKEAGFVSKRGGPAPTVHAFSSFWYPTMKTKDYQGVARWAARFRLAGKQYLDANLILYPICDGGHWRLLVVKPKERTIEYLDSLGWDGSKYVDKLKEYLKLELKEFWNEDEWVVLWKQRSTRQINGSDCGVFAILNALALLRGEEYVKIIACDGMLDARERIATTLMAGVPTAEFN
ncbi:hypothetical protein SNOG_08512 [Parastagonospora nodorum SN15]|uniref:Ubiquitin-like protease family profile domain-containing protein n=1 Tax=Phaeosphaeria nodorum (strain SN15 / ATCC MYA-4574 / FGSC 10173) TaxID=321614 RepID=Q0UIA2_PHANO|nr:hypothetical protein SNOG_08512 [Parastagonospora nodorum SN15]EAT83680.1 hypothetical protein SNOG_08512 [Parastagonospora nodorum SN15]